MPPKSSIDGTFDVKRGYKHLIPGIQAVFSNTILFSSSAQSRFYHNFSQPMTYDDASDFAEKPRINLSKFYKFQTGLPRSTVLIKKFLCK
jgi:hypothetical protein